MLGKLSCKGPIIYDDYKRQKLQRRKFLFRNVYATSHKYRYEFFMICTLESGINIPLRLLIFGFFSRSYGLIPDSIVLIYVAEVLDKYKVSMGLCLFFLTNFTGAMFIQGATFIPDSRVSDQISLKIQFCRLFSF
jgi:hypothetical protein